MVPVIFSCSFRWSQVEFDFHQTILEDDQVMRQCDNLTTINLLTIVGGVSCFVVSMLDGFSCLAGSSAKCVPRDLISLPVLRIMASSVIYLHCCFMLYGRSTSPSRGVAWFFVSSACLDVAVSSGHKRRYSLFYQGVKIIGTCCISLLRSWEHRLYSLGWGCPLGETCSGSHCYFSGGYLGALRHSR